MRFLYCFLLLGLFIVPLWAQEETGILAFERTFDDNLTPDFSIQGSYIIDFGVFDSAGYEDSAGWELLIEGGSTSTFDAQMFSNFEYESTAETVWRLQYKVWADSAPFNITSSLRSVQSPYLGIFHHIIIPEGFEKEWIVVDYTFGPGVFYEATRSSLQFRMGNQPEQTLHIDDIRLYDSNVLAGSVGFDTTEDKELNFFGGLIPPSGSGANNYNNSFELPMDNAYAAGAVTERIQEKGAPDGVQFLRATIAHAVIPDSFVSIVSQNDSDYTGAYRLNVSLRSDKVPLEVQGGLAGNQELSAARSTAPEKITINDKDTWIRASFLIPAGDFTGDDIFPFLRFGGQDNVTVDIDRVFILKTDEEVVNVPMWEIY